MEERGAMDATATELDFEAFEEISYDHLIESLNVEQKAQSRLAKELAQACDMRQELEYLLKSNAGQRPQALPGVSRQRREELDIESFGGMPKDLGEELYRPRLRPCACGCGQMVLGEWTCDGEIAPLRSSDVHAAVARSAPQMSLAEQQASVARLTRRKTPTTSPSAQEKTPSPSPKRRIDRQRLELIALPRELPPPPKPPEPIKARPAPARPQAVATSASEPVLHPGAAAFLAPPRRKVVKLTPQRSMLPGLGSLLFKASLVEEGHVQKEEDFWNPRRRTVPRTPSAQRSYVETRLYPKPSAKTGSLEELEQRLQKAREERLALEKQLCDPKPRPGSSPRVRR